MKLEDIASMLRTTSEVARAGERLFGSLAATRRGRFWPILLGVGAGIGVGALMFDDSLRERIKNWMSEREAERLDGKPPVNVQPTVSAAPH